MSSHHQPVLQSGQHQALSFGCLRQLPGLLCRHMAVARKVVPRLIDIRTLRHRYTRSSIYAYHITKP